MTAQWLTPHVDDLGPPDADEFAPHLSDGNGHDRPGEQAKPGKPRFELVPFNELRPGTEPDYLVAGLIPRVGIVVIWGPPKCGKSFWTFDLTTHVALGWPYRGRRVEAGTVVYCAFEGAAGFKKRAEAFRRHHELEAEPAFYLLAARADLAKDHAALIADIRAQLGDTCPTAIVLDTLNRSLNGSESKDEDMAKYIRGADAIREAFDCAVLIVHHCGVNDTRPRGHTSLTGAVDAQLAVARDSANNIVVSVEWLKDGAEGEQVVSRLEPVRVGADEAGHPLTSCVVIEGEPSAVREIKTAVKLSRSAKALRDAIVEALDAHGADTVIRGNTVRAVALGNVRDEFAKRYVTAETDKTKVANAKSKAFRRSLDRLPAGFGLGAHDGAELVWRA